ncbi:MAG: hypothetical protein C0615_09775 [Desulfuromonas sp.]|nr:MAG: hypothetical protein C0615_09775 [Desulfuromonas sp.]
MTEKEFQKLCTGTPSGTTLLFHYKGSVIRGRFVGCAEDEIVIEANGRHHVWPRELCDYEESSFPFPPSYS